MDATKPTEFIIAEKTDSASAQQSVRRLALTLGFAGNASEEIAIAVAELAANLIEHAGRGDLTLRPLHHGERVGIEIEAEDHGPGIADVEGSFADGYSTKGSLGYGLGVVNRLMDEIDISSAPGSGTHIVCRRWIRRRPEAPFTRVWDVGVVTRSRHFAAENGDAFVLKEHNGGLLVGLIDGLGHGELAQTAAFAAQHFVLKHDDLPLGKIFLGASRACRATRGVVMALARFPSPAQMSFASVGNVEARVWGSSERVPFVVQRGFLGAGEPDVLVQDFTWDPKWMLVLHTDGLQTHWQWDDFPGLTHEPAKVIASRLLRALATDNDDATVLAVKCETI